MKDKQITEQSERSRETNLLVNGLQRMLTPLLGGLDRNRSSRQFDDDHRDAHEL